MFVNAYKLSMSLNFGLAISTFIDILPNIMDEFKIYQPVILDDMSEMNMKEVVKHFNFLGYSVGFSQKQMTQYQSFIIFTNHLNQFKWKNPTYTPILVVSKIENDNVLTAVDVSVGSEVLFLDWNSLKVYESYRINKIQITRYLGKFHTNNGSKSLATFVPSKDYLSNMENRRCDFYGIQLISAVNWLQEDPVNYSNVVHFFPNNNTYDITKLTNSPEYYGTFWNILELEILKIMELKFNFTSKIFLRKDMKIGYPYILPNGSTMITDGIIQNLWEGSVEFVCGYFQMLPIRQHFVDFLPVLWSAHDAIFIPIEDPTEEIDWKVFFKPFAIEVWFAILIKCIIFTTLVSIIEWFHYSRLVRQLRILFFGSKYKHIFFSFTILSYTKFWHH